MTLFIQACVVQRAMLALQPSVLPDVTINKACCQIGTVLRWYWHSDSCTPRHSPIALSLFEAIDVSDTLKCSLFGWSALKRVYVRDRSVKQAQSEGTDTTLSLFNLDARRGEVVSVTPRPLYPWSRFPVPIVEDAVSVWTHKKYRDPRQDGSESLFWLSYRGLRICVCVCVCVYRVSQKERTKLREGVPYVKV